MAEIQWTEAALKNVRKLYHFYCKTASEEVARKIIEPLFHFVKTLENMSEIGQEEPTLKPLNDGHRYLVHNHLKIIYRLKSDTIFITHVFDTRQQPSKLK